MTRATGRAPLLSLLLVALLAAGGCSRDERTPRTGDADAPAPQLRPVRLLLNWFPEAEHGGFYAAKELGYYRDAGLDVDIVPGGRTAVVAQELTLGRAEFGVANADDVLTAAQQEAPLVAVMTPMQHTPRCILVRADSGIEGFDELRGMTLLLDSSRAFVPFLQSLGYLKDDVTITPYFGSVAPLAAGKGYGCQGYTFSEPFLAEQQGIDVNVLRVSELGYDPYCSLLVTTRGLIDKEPELVAAMTRASARGWESYLQDPAPANAAILKVNDQQMTAEALEFGAAAIRELATVPEGMAFGEMEQGRWQTLIGQLEKVGFIDRGAIAADEVYTNRFLDDGPPTAAGSTAKAPAP